MLESVISNMIKEGKTLDEIIQSKPTSQYDTTYQDYSFIKPKDFVTNLYESLKSRQ